MERRRFVRLMAGTAVSAAIPGITACGSLGHYGGATAVYAPGPRPPAYYEYYYYPDVMVYYHVHTGYYYYHFNGAWRRTRQRPGFLYFDDRRRHTIVIRDEQPYERHAEHRQKFPPQPVPPGHARGHGPDPADSGSRGVKHGPVQPQIPPQSQGAGRGNPKPVYQPQTPPAGHGVGQGRGNQGNHGSSQAQNASPQQTPPQSQPQAAPPPQPTHQPKRPPPGKGSAGPSQSCNSGPGKGKGAGGCR